MAYIGKEPANVGQRPSEDTFTATAAQTVFTLGADVDYESDIFVSINGVIQTNAAFALSGTGSRTLTFVSGMTVGDVVRVLHHGYKPMSFTVADGIVGTQKIADNAVTEPKIADNAITADQIAANAVTQAKIHSSVVLGGPSIGTIPNMVRTNSKAITAVITFAGTENGITAGPVTFSGSGAVVVTTGSTWHLLV
ncbi:MAG: hypothetical protein CMF86_00270 [Candidatus Marinimicrobia bacterium]|nr:hypothetical protein [Candidatus Neomarinimicrobiota bacterium]